MARKLGKRQENLLAKIAAQLGTNLDEVKEAALPLYTQEQEVLERQSILNFFKARVRPERQNIKVNGRMRQETDKEFEERYNEWRFAVCKGCNRDFVYAYSYAGVTHCSLECLDVTLRKEAGIEVTRSRDAKMRWGPVHPAIVPSSALESLRLSFPDSEGTYDVPVQTFPPKSPEAEASVDLLANS